MPTIQSKYVHRYQRKPVSQNVKFYRKYSNYNLFHNVLMDVNNFIIKYSASLITKMIRNILDKQKKKKKKKSVPLMGPSKSRLPCFPLAQKRLKCHNLDFPLLKPMTSSI